MEYLVVAFRSRASVFAFYEYLKRNGFNCEIVSTPKEANVGCGLSVKISTALKDLAKNIVNKSGLKNFAGIFWVKMVAGKRIVRTI